MQDDVYVQSLTLKGCFHVYLLKGETFSVVNLNVSLRSGPTSMIRDLITKALQFIRSYSLIEHVLVSLKSPYLFLMIT